MWSDTESMLSSRRWCTFSFLRGSLLAFFALNAILAFFFAWMMDSTELVVFRIPAVEQNWDLHVKAMACRRAGVYFFCSLVLLMLVPFLDFLRGLCRLMFCRLHFLARRKCRRVVPRDRRRLLGHKDSDTEAEELIVR